ncbi:MAG: glycosyltransferase [Polyangiaceae bacterium]|nr:glycosyltransferase [Polyangiaceae bacterium]
MGHAAHAAGHELTVVAPGAAHGTTRECGMQLIRYPAPRMPYDPTYRVPWRLDLMRRLVREARPDVVQISSPFAPALAARALSDDFVRVYVHHSDPIGCYLRPTLERALPSVVSECIEYAAWSWHRSISRFCDATVVAGDWLETELSELGCERVTTVPFGITRSDLGSHCRNEAIRTRLLGPLAAETRAALVLVAGRLAADKRQALLVDALHLVQRERPVALVVLGDGPERQRLEERARGLGHVTFLPFTRNRAEFAGILATADLLLHGSVAETYGFVIAEALASGTPVVVPRAGGAGAFAHPDYSETYGPSDGAAGVARAVQRLLERSRERLEHAAIRAAATFPSSEGHFEQLFALYGRLVRGKARARCGAATTAGFHGVPPNHTRE